MKNRAIVVCFHKYTPFGGEMYESLLDFMLLQLKKYQDEYDCVYLVDSNWEIDPQKIEGMKAKIVKVSPHLRYYDCFKEVLPQIKEDSLLFIDNDLVIYDKGIIKFIFNKIEGIERRYLMAGNYGPLERDIVTDNIYDVASIYDTIGTYKTDKLNGKNKFCPYLFATRKELLIKYRDIEWGPNMPEHETLGKLTEKMLDDGLRTFEMEEDKSNILTNGHQDFNALSEGNKSKDLGYYHIRAGSTPSYLLATKKYGDQDTYWKYLREQPKTEYVRQCAWFWYMNYVLKNQEMMNNISELLKDAQIQEDEWYAYFSKFVYYHGLPLIWINH